MLQIKTILHPTDFSTCAEAALVYAIDLARRHHAELHLFHVASQFGENPILGAIDAMKEEEALYRRLRDEADARMQTLLGRHDTSDIHMKRICTRGATPGQVIVEYAVSENMDLIVLGTHGRRGLRRLLMGSVAEEVTHRASCPVLLIREPDVPLRDVAIDHIQVSIDFSSYSVNALAYAKQLAVLYEATLDVHHVIDPVLNETLQKTGWKYREHTERVLQEHALEKLAWFSNSVRGPAPLEITRHVSKGNPATQINAAAEARKADLLVIASHGLRGLNKCPVGSVTDHVVRAAPCPVFMTRPLGKSLLPREEITALDDLMQADQRSLPA